MRRNKADFYTQDGAGRQLRTLNHKPEKLPQEKQDAIMQPLHGRSTMRNSVH